MISSITKQNTFDGLRWLASLLFLVGFALLVYTFYIEKPKLQYQNLPFPIVNKKIMQGDDVQVIIERCNVSDETLSYTLTRRIRNEDTKQIVGMTEVSVDMPPGCQRLVLEIPLTAAVTPPGKYSSLGSAKLKGMFRTFELPWYSEVFEVVEKPAPLDIKPGL